VNYNYQPPKGIGGPRGSGRTSRQILALPIGAWYFVHHMAGFKHTVKRHQYYFDDLGRSDVVLKWAKTLEDTYMYHGCAISGFDVDHYVFERHDGSFDLIEACNKMRSCVRPYSLGSSKPLRSPICPCGIDRRDCDYHA
jgi:hypothetical protein